MMIIIMLTAIGMMPPSGSILALVSHTDTYTSRIRYSFPSVEDPIQLSGPCDIANSESINCG